MNNMKKLIIAFFLLISVANAQEEQTPEVINTQEIQNEILFDSRVSVYLHPLSIIGNILIMTDDFFTDNLFLYSTVEVPLSLSYSLIIRPSYWYNPDIIRLGSDIGIRYYTDKKSDGFYFQGQMGLFYCSYEIDYGKKENFTCFDIMGYFGLAKKIANFSMFFDFGIGFASKKDGYIFPSDDGRIFDFNIGVGIPLGKKNKK